MTPKKLVPLVTTQDLDALRAFYVDKLGFTTTFDAPMYLGLKWGENAEIGFMTPGGDCPVFGGKGLSLCLEVDDVDAQHDRFVSLGVSVVQAPRDNPWGDRSFVALDPAGVALYVYKPTQPSPEFAKYVKE
ncbi:MAG: VOC family protein [Myxococcota bacterium]